MKLKSVEVSGFRGYREAVSIPIEDDFSVFVGRNDAGKSSVLDALELFFTAGKPDRFDFTVAGISSDIVVTCSFEDPPATVVIDSSAETSWKDQYLLGSDGRLNVRRRWSAAGKGPVTTILANHPVGADGRSLITAKIRELKSLHDRMVPAPEANKSVSSQLRAEIWAAGLANGTFELAETEIALSVEDGKTIEAQINDSLPVFHVFRADRPNTENEGVAQDPAKLVIKQVLDTHQDELGRVAESISREIRALLVSVVDKLDEVRPDLARSININELTPRWEKAFADVGFVDHEEVPLYKRGSGVRRLVLLSFFRAQVEQQGTRADGRSVIVAVEEPESALHPDLQEEVVDALMELGNSQGRQVLTTTHSTNLIRRIPVRTVRYISVCEGARSVSSAASIDEEVALLRELNGALGVLSDHSVRCFLVVEGVTDILALRHLTAGLAARAPEEYLDFGEAEKRGLLRVLPYGGCGAAGLWLTPLQEFGREVVLLRDSDRGSTRDPEPSTSVHPEFVFGEDRAREVVLERRELENYLTPSAVASVFDDADGFEEELDKLIAGKDWNFLDVPSVVSTALKNVGYKGGQGLKSSNVKKALGEAFGHSTVVEQVISSKSRLQNVLLEVSRIVTMNSRRGQDG